ncbi:MAG: J domain-containing protein, partial [Planctomycetes bacterium]|nr:J domain-containing protein [Planctomycetota bacterium]
MIEKAFRTLGLEPGAKADEVRAAYRRLAKRNHPDKFAYDPRQQAQATARMKEINAAYRALRPYLDGRRAPSPAPPPRPPPRSARRAPYRTGPEPELGRNVLRVIGIAIMLILFLSQLLGGGLRRSASPSWPYDPLPPEHRERIR